MICYASRTGTRRNLEALRLANWRLMISPAGVLRTEGFAYSLDNGAWHAWTQGKSFDGPAFQAAYDRFGVDADFVVAPDIVAAGSRSLRLTESWLPRLTSARLVLVAVQNGMHPIDVAPFLSSRVGVFLGGDTNWKLAHMNEWGEFARSYGAYYHVARVNSARRIRLAIAAGADSIDGSSASRYVLTLPLLDAATKQRDLLAGARS